MRSLHSFVTINYRNHRSHPLAWTGLPWKRLCHDQRLWRGCTKIMSVASRTFCCCKQHKPSMRHTLLIRKLIFLWLKLVDKGATAEAGDGGCACGACFLQMCRCVFIVPYVSVCWNSWAMRPVTTVMTPASRKILVDLEGWRVFQQNQWEGVSQQSDIATRVRRMAGMVIRLSTQVATQLMVMQWGCECSGIPCCTLLLYWGDPRIKLANTNTAVQKTGGRFWDNRRRC